MGTVMNSRPMVRKKATPCPWLTNALALAGIALLLLCGTAAPAYALTDFRCASLSEDKTAPAFPALYSMLPDAKAESDEDCDRNANRITHSNRITETQDALRHHENRDSARTRLNGQPTWHPETSHEYLPHHEPPHLLSTGVGHCPPSRAPPRPSATQKA